MTMLIATALVVSACGGEDAATTTSSSPSSIPSTTTPSSATTTTVAATTSTVAQTSTTGREIDVLVEAGQVVGPTTFSFAVGDQVSIRVLSDVDAEIHVHGYDLFFDADAGVPVEISLVADVPGIFEVELEGTHTPLFLLEVTP
jgi:hypothetical protein